MDDYLLFRLYGLLASWGETAVGEVRPSASWPGRSSIIGLLAAAMGVRRDEEDRHRSLTDEYGVAVCVESNGELLRDYHTTQVPPERRGVRYHSRRDELGADTLHTILSQRDYRNDALYTVAVWSKAASNKVGLEQLSHMLIKPHFALYLGRKSCPLALPLKPHLVQADSLRKAFDQAEFPDRDFLSGLPLANERIFVWEAGRSEGMSALQVNRRRDESISRKRWQFAEREEYYRSEPRTATGREN
ncbi:MAG: type I-E CRISPR-associated protein Cas5/CasD [Candidatus Thiodiazotropha sp. (ex Rostrolucina anterorostrata)]|nr:type I-E CRISPR-associated protein Cas5/CasD [Candidatus Thiodiazotropha sp. (ex Rostrolucina anterorostrata)]